MSDLPGSDVNTDQPNTDNDLGWRAALPDDLKQNEVLSGYSNIGDVSKDFLSLKEKSVNALYKPGDNASEEERQTFRSTLNKITDVPETVEGYGISKPEDMPENVIYDEAMTGRLLSALHKVNAPKEVVQSVFKEMNDYNVELHKNFETYVKENEEKGLNSLKDHWKGDFEKKNRETFEVLYKAAEKIKIPDSMGGMNGFKEDIENLGLKNNPRMNVFFNSLFDLIGVDSFFKSEPSANQNEFDAWFPSMKKT